MNNKKIYAFLALLLCGVMAFTACSKTATGGDTVDDAELAAVAETTIKSVESTDISFFEVVDGDNTIRISPIYAKDAKKVIAAYIISVTDKNKKIMSAADFPEIGSVVQASNTKKQITLTKDKDKKLLTVKSYADEKGNLLVIQDYSDANTNKKTDEFLKLTKKTNKKGSTHYVLTDTVVKIVTEDGVVYAIIDGKKIPVDKVDSENEKVKDKITLETASNEEKETTTAADGSDPDDKDDDDKDDKDDDDKDDKDPDDSSDPDKPSSPDGSTDPDSPTDPTKPSEEDEYENIVLKKNGKAESSSSGVSISTGEITITSAGAYRFTSETDNWHGVIKVKLENTENAELRFEDVDITYNRGNIIQIINDSEDFDRSFIEAEASAESAEDDTLNDAMEDLSDRQSAPDVDLTFPTGTSSTFESSANVQTGIIYNESKLTIKGNGRVTMKATSNANNVICSSKSVSFKNVSATLQTSAFGATSSIGGCRGIFAYNKVNIESGTLKIESNGDAVRCTRFNMEGGTFNAESSACDGIDAESSIDISGGTAKVIALKKSAYKVRRVNIQERWDNGERVNRKDGVREGKGDHFKITGGKVVGESKKVSDYGFSPSQNTIVCRTIKKPNNKDSETKTPVKWTVGNLASSDNYCVKFLYSSSAVDKKEYTVKVNNSEKEYDWKWNGKYGACYVVASSSK